MKDQSVLIDASKKANEDDDDDDEKRRQKKIRDASDTEKPYGRLREETKTKTKGHITNHKDENSPSEAPTRRGSDPAGVYVAVSFAAAPHATV